jgi:hypothetical protein
MRRSLILRFYFTALLYQKPELVKIKVVAGRAPLSVRAHESTQASERARAHTHTHTHRVSLGQNFSKVYEVPTTSEKVGLHAT